jgi:hypothetical protein
MRNLKELQAKYGHALEITKNITSSGTLYPEKVPAAYQIEGQPGLRKIFRQAAPDDTVAMYSVGDYPNGACFKWLISPSGEILDDKL